MADVVARIERRERLPADPWLELVAPPSPGRAAVAAFPAHFVVAADVDRSWVESLIPNVDFGDLGVVVAFMDFPPRFAPTTTPRSRGCGTAAWP